MAELNNVIAVIGENGCGKTTISLELAKKLESHGKSVIIINLDVSTPLISYVNKDYEKYTISLGDLLTKEQNPKRIDLETALYSFSDNIGILSFIYGDYYNKYSKYDKERILEIYELAKNIADYLIIDLQSNVKFITTHLALDYAKKILMVATPTRKSLSYYDTLKRTIGTLIFEDKKYLIINKVSNYSYPEQVATNLLFDDYIVLPYIEDIKINESRLEQNKPINNHTHNNKLFNRNIDNIIYSVFGIKPEKEEKILEYIEPTEIIKEPKKKNTDISTESIKTTKKLNIPKFIKIPKLAIFKNKNIDTDTSTIDSVKPVNKQTFSFSSTIKELIDNIKNRINFKKNLDNNKKAYYNNMSEFNVKNGEW